MRLIEQIKEIRNAAAQNRLVIFVGAGVSRNSGIPDWKELIDSFATALGIDKCDYCRSRSKHCPKKDCGLRQHLCQDEFLKIPQYYYDSRSKKDYYKLMQETLSAEDASPNEIDDIIFRILPHHIITTNYDKLLEKSEEPNRKLYAVIAHDGDILGQEKSQYIIKMHGDFEHESDIVLKESDYLEYEQKHPLIQAYIKALLIDHSFLFVGYSLNDYNLKQIISWINYFAKYYKANMPRNYIVQASSQKLPNYISKSYNQSHISIVDASRLPQMILSQYDSLSIGEQGKKLYAILDCIYNEHIADMLLPPDEVMLSKIKPLNDYLAVSIDDFSALYSLPKTRVLGRILTFHDKGDYDQWLSILTSSTNTSNEIRSIISKTIFTGMQHESSLFMLDSSLSPQKNERFEAYLNNDYMQLFSLLNGHVSHFEKSYYYHIIIPQCENCYNELQLVPEEISIGNYALRLLFYKYNIFLWKKICQRFGEFSKEKQDVDIMLENLPAELKTGSVFFRKLWGNMAADIGEMQALLNKHKEIYDKDSKTIRFGSSLDYLLELKSRAYNYYFFFKYNYLFLDHFSDPQKYFAPYIEAILRTQSSILPKKQDLFGMEVRNQEVYVIEKIDIDIITKFSDKKQLMSWFSDFKIEELILSQDVDIVHLYVNLINSLFFSFNTLIMRYIYTLSLMVSRCELKCDAANEVYLALAKMCQWVTNQKDDLNEDAIENILTSISAVVSSRIGLITSNGCQLFSALTQDRFIEKCYNLRRSDYAKLLHVLSKDASRDDTDRTMQYIKASTDDRKKVRLLYLFRDLLLNADNEWRSFLQTKVELLRNNELLQLVIGHNIAYTGNIQVMLTQTIDDEITKRKASPGTRAYPDHLCDAIDTLIILYLFDFPIDIPALAKYTSYSEQLVFLLEPEEFDYSKVDISDYRWQNMFRTPKTADLLKRHADKILTRDLEQNCKNGLFSEEEYRIVFGELLDSTTLWQWGT